MRKLLRSLPNRLIVRGFLALSLLAAAVVLLPRVVTSRFVAERRAAFALKRAQAHLASGDFIEARTEFQSALRLQPGNGPARRQLAEMELALGNTELAFLQYELLTEMRPEDPEGWVRMAELMVKTGQLEAPEATLDKAINLDGSRADARLQRGEIRFRLGRYHGALQDARAVVEEVPGSVPGWGLLVRSAARSQGPEAGMEAATKAIARLGEQPELLAPLAALLAQRSHGSEAREMLLRNRMVSAKGSDAAWRTSLSLARIDLGAENLPEARAVLNAMLQERPQDEEVLALRAVVEALGGNLESSLDALDAAVAAQPKSRSLREVRDRLRAAQSQSGAVAALAADMAALNLGPLPAPPRRLRPDAQTGRGSLGAWTREHWPGRLAEIRQSLEVDFQQRDWSGSQRVVDATEAAFPGSIFTPYARGLIELAEGNLEDAERKLTEALSMAPRLPAIVAALGRTWSLQKGPPFAAQQLMRLAARDPELSLARYMAARAYIEVGDPLRAEASLTRGLELQPDSPVPYQHLTDYYFGLDRTAEALDICRQGLSRFPQNTDLQMMLAQIAVGTGQTIEASRTYDELVTRRPDLDLALYKLAVLRASEPGEDARREFLAALGQLKGDRPSDPLLLDALGWMQYRAQDARGARSLLEAAAKGAPEEPSVRYHLAVVYAQQGEISLEREELNAALESPRPFPERIDALRLLRLENNAPAAKTNAGAAGRQ